MGNIIDMKPFLSGCKFFEHSGVSFEKVKSNREILIRIKLEGLKIDMPLMKFKDILSNKYGKIVWKDNEFQIKKKKHSKREAEAELYIKKRKKRLMTSIIVGGEYDNDRFNHLLYFLDNKISYIGIGFLNGNDISIYISSNPFEQHYTYASTSFTKKDLEAVLQYLKKRKCFNTKIATNTSDFFDFSKHKELDILILDKELKVDNLNKIVKELTPIQATSLDMAILSIYPFFEEKRSDLDKIKAKHKEIQTFKNKKLKSLGARIKNRFNCFF